MSVPACSQGPPAGVPTCLLLLVIPGDQTGHSSAAICGRLHDIILDTPQTDAVLTQPALHCPQDDCEVSYSKDSELCSLSKARRFESAEHYTLP